MIVLGLVAVLYAVASLSLFLFGSNLIAMAIRVWKRGPKSTSETQLDRVVNTGNDLPLVTIQLPIYNELYVSERVIDAAAQVDYPVDRLQIQVLDDSTDETTVLIAHAVQRWQDAGVNIEHIRRDNRTGYKAGALAEGLKSASGEFVAIFDADFVPTSDFLLRTLPHFTGSDGADVAFVQARWGHVNRDQSWLTRLQALAIDGHFLVEQAGRGQAGYWFNFNGTAGIWRAAAISDAGGWKADTLTEDLDLSYRAYLEGWRAVFLQDLVVPAEVPAAISGFRRQQHRWARGSIECAVRLLPRVWRAKESLGVKMQATLHLLAYGIHLTLLLLTIIYPVVIELVDRYPRFSTLYGLAYLLALSSLAPTIFFVTGRHQAGLPWGRELPRILIVSIFGSGLMVNTARAALQILTRPNPEFERTAKFGDDEAAGPDNQNWTNKRYQLNIDRIVLVEATLAGYSFWTATRAYASANWGIFIWSVLFGLGLAAVVLTTIGHAFAIWRHRESRALSVARERNRLNRGEPALQSGG